MKKKKDKHNFYQLTVHNTNRLKKNSLHFSHIFTSTIYILYVRPLMWFLTFYLF